MSVGIEELDRQHQGLLEVFNDFHARMQAGRGREGLGDVLAGLARYAEVHFATEERLFDQYGYPDAGMHRAEHQAFIENVRDLQAEVAAGKRLVSLTTLNLLRDWLANHVMNVDMEYKPFFVARGLR